MILEHKRNEHYSVFYSRNTATNFENFVSEYISVSQCNAAFGFLGLDLNKFIAQLLYEN